MSRSVSVAMATCEGAAHLESQLQSILRQSRPVQQIVISDDASNDGTIGVVRQALQATDIDVVLIENTQRVGFVKNFERALRACDGDVILLSDQDDVWLEDRVKATLSSIRGSRSLAFGDALVGPTADDTMWRRSDFKYRSKKAFRRDAFRFLMSGNVVMGATTAVTRDLLDDILPFPDVAFHDYWMGCMAAAVAEVTLIDQPVIRYRQHGANTSGGAPDVSPTRRAYGRLMAGEYGDRRMHLTALAERLRFLAPTESTVAETGANFLRDRETYSHHTEGRLRGILPHLCRGHYHHYSRGVKNALWDIIRPAG